MSLPQLLSDLQSERFRELRPAQAAVLVQYEANSELSDVAIELPTGAGKSLLALLICEERRREGETVAILTGNKQLARQMEAEASLLNVPVVRFEGQGSRFPVADRRSYKRAEAIAVMNYWVYFNQNPAVDPADLLVLDDAHLVEGALDSLYSCVIDRYEHSSLYSRLVEEMSERLDDYAVLSDANLTRPGRPGTELLSFLDQDAVADLIEEIVESSEELKTDADLYYRWERLRPNLAKCNIYMSVRSMALRPQIYPLRSNRHYEEAQRIYMSATIGNPADLSRRLGSDGITLLDVDPADGEQTYGRRMLVVDPGEDEGKERILSAIETALAAHPKCLWLCVSDLHANETREEVIPLLEARGIETGVVAQLSSEGDELPIFRAADRGHLFVAGRFDGMDFRGDECRLVAFPRMPSAINLQEEFFNAYLRDATFMLQRLNQRILQGLGRCNRAEDDFAVYVLGEPRFAIHFGKETHRTGLPEELLAEIDLAEDQTELPLEELNAEVQKFLGGDFTSFDERRDQALANLPQSGTDQLGGKDDSVAEVKAWLDLFTYEDYSAAAESFDEASRLAGEREERELGAYLRYLEAKARFLEGKRGDIASAARAQAALEEAIEWGGAKSPWFNRLRGSLNRAKEGPDGERWIDPNDYPAAVVSKFDEMLEQIGKRGSRFERLRARIESLLESNSHGDFQEGLELLGNTLAYNAIRPRYGAATDCRWRGVFGNQREAVVWEAKIEHQPDQRVSPHDIGQAHNQRTRAEEELGPASYTVRSAIVTALESLETAAEASRGSTVIVERAAVIALFQKAMFLLGRYREEWDPEDPACRIRAAAAVQSLLPPTGWLERALAVPGPFVDANHLLAEWPA